MRIVLVTPSPGSELIGNRMTTRRYAGLLKELGHRVQVVSDYGGEPCQLLIALHARRSFKAVQRFRQEHPDLPLILVLTGTDLYRDMKTNEQARQALQMATRLVVLQKMALRELSARFQARTRVIYQSAGKGPIRVRRSTAHFRICVIGHLRPEKDPFRAAMASRGLPASSRIRVIQIGRALSERMEQRASRENAENPRYRWLGELPHWRTRRLLSGSHLLALTSRMEGSSNVLCEALSASVPVVASRIPGLIGTLGEDYPGYFPAGDTRSLAHLLERAEIDKAFYHVLRVRCAEKASLVSPSRELESWRSLLDEL